MRRESVKATSERKGLTTTHHPRAQITFNFPLKPLGLVLHKGITVGCE